MSISDESALMDSGLHSPGGDKTNSKEDPLWQRIQKKVCYVHICFLLYLYLFVSLDIYSLVQQPLEEGRYPNSRDRQRLQGWTQSPETSGSHLRRESPRAREGQPQNTFGKQCRKGSGVPKIQRHEACWNARGR